MTEGESTPSRIVEIIDENNNDDIDPLQALQAGFGKVLLLMQILLQGHRILLMSCVQFRTII